MMDRDTIDWRPGDPLFPRSRRWRRRARHIGRLSLCAGFALIAGISLAYAQVPPQPNIVGGVYNATPPTFRDKTGAPLQTDVNGILKTTGTGSGGSTGVPQGSATSGQSGDLVQGAVTTAAPTYVTGTTNPLSIDVAGNLRVGGALTGNVASGAADSGNPIKVGGVYNSTLPTFTNGQRGDIQIGSRGSTNVTLVQTNTANAMDGNSPADGQSNAQSYLRSIGWGYHFNGTTWDRKPGNTVGEFSIQVAAPTGGASFLNIAAGQATTTVKSGAGTLYAIVLNSAATATNTTTIYDNTAGSGTVIGRPAVTTATVPTTLTLGATGIAFATGLTIVTATANGGDMTVVYK